MTKFFTTTTLGAAVALMATGAMAGSWAPPPSASGDSGGEGLLIMLAIGALLILNGTRNSDRGKTVEQDVQDDDDIIMKF